MVVNYYGDQCCWEHNDDDSNNVADIVVGDDDDDNNCDDEGDVDDDDDVDDDNDDDDLYPHKGVICDWDPVNVSPDGQPHYKVLFHAEIYKYIAEGLHTNLNSDYFVMYLQFNFRFR